MANLVKLAKAYSKSGFSVIPVTARKLPALKGWKEFQSRPMTDEECERYFSNCYGIALLCGGKKKVTCIDFDLKYDLSKDLFDRYKSKIPKELLKKMYVQKTVSGGYHFVFTCAKMEPNQKLANRRTTAYEKHQTYLENFENPETRDKALKIALNDDRLVLIETRGEGGYFCIAPTPNYEAVHGKIQEISEEEYDTLIEVARSFNEIKEYTPDIRLSKYDEWELSPFEDYNQRGDMLFLMTMNGWTIDPTSRGKRIRLKRPGRTHAQSSALYDDETKIFNVFTTSSSFEINKGYNPSGVFIHLECHDDTKLAFEKLVEMGYGKK